jgi:hypothetical protein
MKEKILAKKITGKQPWAAGEPSPRTKAKLEEQIRLEQANWLGIILGIKNVN